MDELARTTSELGPACGELSVGELDGADERLGGAATSRSRSRSMSAVSSRRKAAKSNSPWSEGAATVRSWSMAA